MLNVASKIWEIYVFCKVANAIRELARGIVEVKDDTIRFMWGEHIRMIRDKYKYGVEPEMKPTITISSPTNVYTMYFQFPTIAFNIDIAVITPEGQHLFIDAKLHPSERDLDQLYKYRRIVSDVEREFGESHLAVVYYHAPTYKTRDLLREIGIDLISKDEIELYLEKYIRV